MISIHAPRMGSDLDWDELFEDNWISIHAPRMGSDDFGLSQYARYWDISIHAPRMGSDEVYVNR